MKLDNFPHVLCINLNRSRDRYDIIKKMFEVHNISHTRIEAIDGENITRNKFDDITNYEIACTLSHIKALKYFIDETELDEILICEDDLSFEFNNFIPNNWSYYYNKFKKYEESNDNINMLVQLCIISRNNISLDFKLTTIDDKYYSTCIYYVNRDTAKKLILHHENNKIVRADEMIFSLGTIISIPLFTYNITHSLINPSNKQLHVQNKRRQYKKWNKQNN